MIKTLVKNPMARGFAFVVPVVGALIALVLFTSAIFFLVSTRHQNGVEATSRLYIPQNR